MGISKKNADVNIIVNHLNKSGYSVRVCEDGNSLIRMVRSRNTDVVIVHDDIKGLRAIDIVNIIYTEKICPVVLFSSDYGTDYCDWIEKGWIYSYLHLPVDTLELTKAIKSAVAIGSRIQQLENQVLRLQRDLTARKVIERAKGVLMQIKKCSEEDAYQYLRKTSMNKGVSLEKLSQAIVSKYKRAE